MFEAASTGKLNNRDSISAISKGPAFTAFCLSMLCASLPKVLHISTYLMISLVRFVGMTIKDY